MWLIDKEGKIYTIFTRNSFEIFEHLQFPKQNLNYFSTWFYIRIGKIGNKQNYLIGNVYIPNTIIVI